jgi:polyketide synthase PksN
LNQETAHLLCRTVAVPDWDAAAAIARAECGAECEAEAAIEVRYAGGKRWIGEVAEAAPRRESNPLRRQGVYLITGGLGGIGVRLAEHLARKYQARLALCGRSEPGAEGAAAIERLGKLGAEVLYVRGDVARRQDVEALVAAARRQYGRIHGIFHLAGAIRDALMINKRWQDFAAVLAPKVDGAVNLDEACRNEELDLFALFSSVAGLAGNRGQADYAYANRFLDEFAGHREKLRAAGLRSGRTLSIGWPLWAEGGMQVAPPDRQRLATELGMEPLATEAAMAAIETILESDAGPKITVFSGNAEKLRESHRRPPVAPSAPVAHPPRDREALRAAAETLLKDIIGEHLKTPAQRIDPSVCFEDYGIDSIMINAFNARMEAAIGAFPKTLMFEYRTIGELAEYLAEHHAGQLAPIAPRAPAPKSADGANLNEGIAIIGMSGRYPEAANLREFWSNLEAGRDCISPVPADRWDTEAFREEIYCPYGGFLEDADRFDPLFFGISPRDAEKMDPQERIFLETAWATVEDAGYSRARLAELRARGCETGVFVGVTSNTYLLWGAEAERQGVTAIPESMPWSIANRVSYIFDLHGPSMPVDTACSSSLSAIHLACESLRRGECGMALAGGVNLYLHPSKYALLCQLNMLSRGGKCRSFGQGADGFVPGEGAGAVLLKPLGRALADGDPIHAVIRGSSVNHGGRTNGYTVPNPQSQADLIAAALEAGGIDPRTIGYVEAHGTGTALGDPVEIAGLTKAFQRTTGDRQFCAVGSVKSNIGHLESAAGIAGLAKVALQMKHRRLAPSLHAERLNENIVFEDTPFYVVREAGEWKAAEGMPRRAAVSSFGAGGSNAHLVVEEYCGGRARGGMGAAIASGRPQVFVVSARNAERLQAAARNLCEYLREGSAGAEEIAYTLQTGREAMAERLAVVAGDRDQLRLGLEAFLRGELPEGVYRGNEKAGFTAARENGAATPGALAAAWVNGAAVDWEALYPDGKPARVSLPSYPFAGRKYWIFDREAARLAGSKAAEAKVRALGPLLDRNTSSLAEVRFTKEFTGEEFYLADHVLGGWKTLPGVLSLEMARAAAEIAGERRVSRLANVVWLRPVVLDQGPATIHIRLKSVPDAVEFEIYSLGGGQGERCAYTQGKVMFEEPAAPRAAVKLDLAAIRARCGTVLGAGEFYRGAAGQGFCYGPSFQAVESLWRGDGEALARLALPEAAGAAAGYGLHPALLDGALQALSAIAGRAGAAPPKIPFSLKALEIRGAVVGACYAYVAPAQYRNGGGTGDPAYDLWVLNAEGEAALVFQSLTMRAVPQEPRDEDPLLTLLKQLEAGEVRLEDARSRLEYAT